MGEPGKLDGPSALMALSVRARSCLLLLPLAAMLAWPALVSGAVSVSASVTEALYSATPNMDCAKLHPLEDKDLPLNVVRLHATVPGVPADQVSFRWSVRKPEF